MAQVGSRIPEPAKGSNNNNNIPSRLQQMQAQFQRRLQEEKDVKMLGSLSAPASLLAAPSGGSVRQFFAQRRAAAQSGSLTVNDNRNNNNPGGPKHGSPVGWDKSYPLSPIKRSGSSSGSSSGYESVTNGKPPPGYQKDKRSPVSLKPPARRAPSLDRKAPTNLPKTEIKRSSSQILAGSNTKENNNYQQAQPRVAKPSPPPNRRQPPKWVPTKAPAPVDYQPTAPPPRRPQNLFGDSMSVKPKPASLPASKVTTPVASYGTRTVAKSPVASPPQKPSGAMSFFKPKQKQQETGAVSATAAKKEKPKSTVPLDPNMAECSVCGRRFNKDRIAKHEEVCRKASTKKRKVFDPTKMRVKGTELEEFMMNNKHMQKGKAQEQVQPKKSDWRQKRAAFIEALHQAKVVQQHVAAGGKVSDLPPPPPMDTSDYIQCPHCNRKFAAGAAERHIPKCKNIRSNKK